MIVFYTLNTQNRTDFKWITDESPTAKVEPTFGALQHCFICIFTKGCKITTSYLKAKKKKHFPPTYYNTSDLLIFLEISQKTLTSVRAPQGCFSRKQHVTRRRESKKPKIKRTPEISSVSSRVGRKNRAQSSVPCLMAVVSRYLCAALRTQQRSCMTLREQLVPLSQEPCAGSHRGGMSVTGSPRASLRFSVHL